jgi:hypothetical protein
MRMLVDSRISPHYSDDKYKTGLLEDLIGVLEDRIKFWLLGPARALLDNPFGRFAALFLLLGYFEPYAIYRGENSTKSSKVLFQIGFVDVFRRTGLDEDLLGRVADLLYKNCRCGLFHEAMVGEGIYVGTGRGALTVTVPRLDGKPDHSGSVESVLIDPPKLHREVDRHFAEYVALLSDPTNADLRRKFKRAVDRRWRTHEPGRAIGMSKEEF